MGVRSLDKGIFAVIAVMVITALTLGILLGCCTGQVSLVETPAYSGNLVVTVETESGTVVYEVPNTVVDIGKGRVTDYLRVGTAGEDNATEFISLSNDTLNGETAWTNLPNELTGNGLARAAGTVTDVSNVEFTVVKKFAATGTVTVQCSGLNWALENDTSSLWAAATFASTTLNDGDNITITWTVTHN